MDENTFVNDIILDETIMLVIIEFNLNLAIISPPFACKYCIHYLLILIIGDVLLACLNLKCIKSNILAFA